MNGITAFGLYNQHEHLKDEMVNRYFVQKCYSCVTYPHVQLCLSAGLPHCPDGSDHVTRQLHTTVRVV